MDETIGVDYTAFQFRKEPLPWRACATGYTPPNADKQTGFYSLNVPHDPSGDPATAMRDYAEYLSFAVRPPLASAFGPRLDASRKDSRFPSRIVHAGNAEALTDATMREVTRVTRLVLGRLLTAPPFGRMSTEPGLESWFEQQLLAGEKRSQRSPPSVQSSANRRQP